MQCVSLVKRYIKARGATPEKIIELWDPPEMRIALPYAQLFWLFASAVFYGPLSPFFYGLAAVFTFFSFACTKFGVVYWYKLPPAITTEMGGMFRRLVVLLLPFQLLVKLFVRRSAERDGFDTSQAILFSAGFAACGLVIATLAPSANYDHETKLSKYQALDELDTEGVRYDQVKAVKGYSIDHYDNPYRRGELLKTRTGFFGEVPPPPAFIATTTETVEQNSAALTSSLPFEDIPVPPIEDVFSAA